MSQSSRIIACSLLLIVSTLGSSQEDSAQLSLVGSWEGPLVLGRDNMNLAFTFSMKEGNYSAALISGGMGIYGMPADTVRIEGLNVIITGTLRLDETGENIIRIDGDWFQYSEMVPVVLLPVDEPTF